MVGVVGSSPIAPTKNLENMLEPLRVNLSGFLLLSSNEVPKMVHRSMRNFKI